LKFKNKSQTVSILCVKKEPAAWDFYSSGVPKQFRL